MSYSNLIQPTKIPQPTFQQFLQFYTYHMLDAICREWNKATFQIKESVLEFH